MNMADRIEHGEEPELVAAASAKIRCELCDELGDGSCTCAGGPYAAPGVMFGALLDAIAERAVDA